MDETPSETGPTEATPSDEFLLRRLRHAAPEERQTIVDQLFARHYEKVARWCYRFTGEREAAADLAQEVFLKAHRHLESFQGSSQFATWLYSIARNESINRARRQPSAEIDSDEALVDVPSLEPDPEALASESSRNRQLQQFLLTTLDPTERTVFTLHYGDEMSLDAITRLLNLSNSSGAKAYIVSARRKLARAVEKLRARGGSL
jgi:RNA polymerase sigma-70 factor (ECF subfamily)